MTIIKGNLGKLPDEKIQEILSNALTEFFKTENGRKLFYYTTNGYYETPKPTEFLVKMIENAASKDLLKPCVDEFVEHIKNNYERLIKETMIRTFSNMFFSQLDRDIFESKLHDVIDKKINDMQ